MDEIEGAFDLGNNHIAMWYGWNPDRNLNPQFAHLPDVEHFTLAIAHLTPDGKPCQSAIHFHGEVQDQLLEPSQIWDLRSAPGEPLTVVPSVLCMRCQDHGFITDGKWIKV